MTCKMLVATHCICSCRSASSHKSRPPTFPLTSPALLLAEDAALGVGDRCRVTRAMAGGLRRPWRAAEEQGREGRRMRRCFCLCHRVENNASSDPLIQRHLTPQKPALRLLRGSWGPHGREVGRDVPCLALASGRRDFHGIQTNKTRCR